MLDYTKQLSLAQSLDEVWDLHCAAMARFGFDRVLYGLTHEVGTDGSLGDLEDALVLSNHGHDYDAAFITSGLFTAAPGFGWARRNVGTVGWGALWGNPKRLGQRGREVIAFQRSWGVRAGYTVSIAQNNARTFAVVSLTGRPGLSQADLDAVWAKEGCQIWTMINLMHLKILSLPHWGCGVELSGRQREALEWVGDGKSYQDIATIMGVSMATVEKHLRLAREKLRVATTSQAVLKAALQNRIYPPNGSAIFHGPTGTDRDPAVSPCPPAGQTFTKM